MRREPKLKIRIWPQHRPAIATIGVRKALACAHACPGEGWFALLRKTLSLAWLVAMAAPSLGYTDDALDPTPISPTASIISPEPIAPPAPIMPPPCVMMRAAITSQATASSTQPTRPLSSRRPKRAWFCPAALQSAHSRVDSAAYRPTLTPFRGELRAGAEIPQALARFGQRSAVTL